jgi:tryptophan halogenase
MQFCNNRKRAKAMSEKNDSDISRIVFVGGGTAGWMAAAAFSKYFDNGRRSFTLIESDAIGTVGVGEATIPPIANFNHMLDISESEFLRATNGTFKLGIEFVDWGQIGDRYFHPFGEYGQDLHGIAFHQLYLREHARGATGKGKNQEKLGDIANYSMSSMAARHGKFGRAKPDAKSLIRQIGYAYHFDAGLYAKFLRQRAEKQGTKRCEGKIASAQRDPKTGDIVSVTLESGEVISGDLFVDCSGFRGLLIEDSLQTGYEDWSHWLPVDRAIALPCANPTDLDPYTRSTAHSAGWQWRIPLQHRTGNGHVFCSSYMEADEAEKILRENLEGEPVGEARHLRFLTGMRRKAWSQNVIALGLSSGFIEPLESTSIHLIQNGIARLFALFPDKQISSIERDEYNRGMRELFEDIRDFIILHYKATQRDDSEFWRYVRDMDIPETLHKKIELWRLHGRVFRENAELFTTPSWVAVMLGQNIWPRRHDPIADTLDEEKVALAMSQMREAYERTAEQMPTQIEFLKQSGSWASA